MGLGVVRVNDYAFALTRVHNGQIYYQTLTNYSCYLVTTLIGIDEVLTL